MHEHVRVELRREEIRRTVGEATVVEWRIEARDDRGRAQAQVPHSEHERLRADVVVERGLEARQQRVAPDPRRQRGEPVGITTGGHRRQTGGKRCLDHAASDTAVRWPWIAAPSTVIETPGKSAFDGSTIRP